jgi:hypothetical protein
MSLLSYVWKIEDIKKLQYTRHCWAIVDKLKILKTSEGYNTSLLSDCLKIEDILNFRGVHVIVERLFGKLRVIKNFRGYTRHCWAIVRKIEDLKKLQRGTTSLLSDWLKKIEDILNSMGYIMSLLSDCLMNWGYSKLRGYTLLSDCLEIRIF